MQPRLQNWRPPTHKSKLSKQYMPTEDSDEESSSQHHTGAAGGGERAGARRRSKYMSGAALELNTGPRQEETRARTLSNASLSGTSSDNADTVSLNSLRSSTKKLSLGKRISTFFRGSNSKATNSAPPVSTLTQSLSNAAAAAAAASGEDSPTSRSTTSSLAPIDELTPPDRVANSLYMHHRSQSSPDHVGRTSFNQNYASTSAMDESRLRTARDSGFEEAGGGKGHRRHSSSIATPAATNNATTRTKGGALGTSSPQLQPYQPGMENQRSSLYSRNEGVYIDQQHPQQQHRRLSTNPQLSTSSPQLPSHVDNELQLPAPQRHNNRHSFMSTTDMANYHHHHHSSPVLSATTTPKRGSTPLGFAPMSSPGDTLISKVDREKASVCFQAPTTKKETFTRDAHLDPAFSSLVQQHRKDFKTNQRLGGTPQMAPQQIYSPQFQGHQSPRQRVSTYMLDDHHQIMPPPPMMTGAGSRRDSNGSQTYGYPTNSPGLYAVDAQMNKRLSTSSQFLQQAQQQHQQHHPNYPYSGTTAKLSGSQGSLHHPGGLYYDQSLQGSPIAGPQITSSPKHLSSAGYFTAHQTQPQPPTLLQVSPFPSPNLIGLPTSTSPLPEYATYQQQQPVQHQLEQLQQIRIQQQQVLLQQQQQLQQQLQQTRVAVAAVTQQQQHQQQMAQVGLGLDMMMISPGGGGGLGAVSPLALSPAVFQTQTPTPSHAQIMMTPHYQQQQQQLQQQQLLQQQQQQQQQRLTTAHNNHNIMYGAAVPMQTYPAGTVGHR
ncbi:MAG: hypothetical protein J3R72DRAFT_82089 [Linnemannia gamsii]|nr:MAG: hypothetical protein J3R72DRAFT_82089 [Linnemannia gamsii]